MATPHDDEVLGKAYDARLMRRLLPFIRPYRWVVLAAIALLFAEGALQLVGPALTRHVIDVALPARDEGRVVGAALLFAGALLLQFACGYGETVLTGLLGQRVMRDLRAALFAHLQRLPVAYFDRNPVGRLVTRVTSDVEALNELFTAGVVSGLGDLFTLIAIGAMMLAVDWRLALAAFVVIPFIAFASRAFQARVRGAYRDIRTRLARINAFLQERLSGMRVVQLFGRERAEAARFDALNRAHLEAHVRSIRYYAVYYPVIEVLTTVALASLLVASARRVGVGTLSVGTVAAFLQLVRRFFQPLQDLAEKFNVLQGAMAAAERIFQVLDTPAAELRPPSSVPRPESAPSGRTTQDGARSPAGVTVAFEDVWFRYADDAPWVLQGVGFVARPGETVALVGHTGAGKTTVVSLLLRFYEPQRGRITVNGVDVRELPLDALRALIGYVQQDIFLFAGDVASNIRLSSAIDDAAVATAAARVGADRVVRRLPGGYGYELGERGASVSVGERQLLAFARAVAADPAVLVLDEATSAVDSESEALIQDALAELMRGRTTIAVAHRLTTIVGADEILVMHHGRVVERGPHRGLLARGGLYERLYRLQVGEATAGGRAPAAEGSARA
jgi:ATP-binding cassette, subfamily B, multidrug efflux pump